MFLPEDLLFRSGQLSRVWLAANQQKKLTKAQVLQDKIDEDIEVIIRPEAAAGGPLALRLNAQLLIGVVRIYQRKANYLHDDCNDALWKIKMAFRPGNIDLPAQTHIANPTSLTLPDMITDLDLLAPMPDPAFLFQQQPSLDFGNTTVPDWDNSQFLSGSIEQQNMDLDLGVDDLGLDLGDDDPPLGIDEGTSIEVGRNAPLERRASEELESGLNEKLFNDDLGLDLGDEDGDELSHADAAPELNVDADLDVTMGGMTEMDLPETTIGGDLPVRPAREESVLSELEEDAAARLAKEVQEQNTTLFEPGQEEEVDETIHQARSKRRKVIAQDAETMITSKQLKEQQNNRDKILKPASFLPRDPLLMALLNMQKSGGFISSILGDGRSQGWAPELRGILSLEIVSRPSKRKRDSGVADLGTTEDEAAADKENTPQLEFEQDDPTLGGADFGLEGGNTTLGEDGLVQLPDDFNNPQLGDDEDDLENTPDNFDDTTAPLVYPEEAGPVSLGTKHAVHLLRERFGPAAEESESERQKTSLVFQNMLPESRTSRTDATKMFFEVLVLATKDAIKVEQTGNELGGPLRIRAKRGLWGQWAETGAGGELASQQNQDAPPQVREDAPAESMMQVPREISVSA